MVDMELGVNMDPAVNLVEEVSREGAGCAIIQHHQEAEKIVQALIHKQPLVTLLNAQVGCTSSLLTYLLRVICDFKRGIKFQDRFSKE